MNRTATIVSALLLSLAASATASAQSDVFEAVPGDALGVIVIHQLGDTAARIEKMGHKMQLPVPAILPAIQAQVGIQEGIDPKGSVAILIMPRKEGTRTARPIVMVPVSDYKQVAEQLKVEDSSGAIAEVHVSGQPMLIAKKGNYAVLASPEDKGILQHVLDTRENITSVVEPLRAWFAKNQVTAVATPRGIKQSLEGAQNLVKQFPLLLPEKEVAKFEGGMKLISDFLTSARGEVTHFAVGLRIDDESAIHLGSRTLFAPGGKFARSVGSIKAPEDLLAGLPAVPFAFVMAGVYPEDWGQALAKLKVQSMKINPVTSRMTPEQMKKLAEATASFMRGTRSIAMVFGTTGPDEPLYSNAVALMRVDDAQQTLARYEKSMRDINEIFKDDKDKLIHYEIRRIQIGDLKAIEVDMDMTKMMPDPGAVRMMEAMFGPGGKSKFYFAALDANTVGLAYVRPDLLEQAAEALHGKRPGLEKDGNIAKTRELLPEGAQLVGYVSPAGLINFGKAFMVAASVTKAAQFPEFPQTPPIGMAAKLSAGGVETDLVVPAAVLETLGGYVRMLSEPRPNQAREEVKRAE